jgi:hypothetical protein
MLVVVDNVAIALVGASDDFQQNGQVFGMSA